MAFTKEYFDEGIYRMGTRCEKWDELRQREGGDILPLWVADMDFPSPPGGAAGAAGPGGPRHLRLHRGRGGRLSGAD